LERAKKQSPLADTPRPDTPLGDTALVDTSHVDGAHVDGSHIDTAHVDGSLVEVARVEASRNDGALTAVPDDNEVIEAIIHASRAMVAIAIRSLAETETGEAVTLPQYRTLVVLSDGGGRRLADLADALGVSPSTATRMCDRLVRKGLITRTRDELDRREVNLDVTAAGRTTVMDVINRRRSDVCALLNSIPVGTRRELVDSLRLLSAATGDAPELHWMPGWHE
jgi:DNA-binding MarR family transcriptional regulator